MMRDEFASNSFLAVTVAGLVLLCSGLLFRHGDVRAALAIRLVRLRKR